MSLATITRHGPEISDAIVSFDPVTLQRKPVKKADIESVGARMLTVYVPYALILLITFLVRAVPSVDIRSITSVLIFGPFTFIRPLVVLAGAVWGVVAAPGAITIALTVLIVCFMLGLGGALSWLRSRGLIY